MSQGNSEHDTVNFKNVEVSKFGQNYLKEMLIIILGIGTIVTALQKVGI